MTLIRHAAFGRTTLCK